MKSLSRLLLISLFLSHCTDDSTSIFDNDNNSDFYLNENGITVMCSGTSIGKKGEINGIEYESVDNNLLRTRIDEGTEMSKLCVSNVTDMSTLFAGTQSNYEIGNWDVSNVTTMREIFAYSKFDQDISNWDVSNVKDMSGMFANSIFNQNIGNWDVSNVEEMGVMFSDSEFNQDIGSWDVSSVLNMNYMFSDSKQFNQDIGS